MRAENVGSSFDDFLEEEGMYEQVTAVAIKRVLARQIGRQMSEEHLSKTAMAKRMQTSRAQLERLLDPASDAVPLTTLTKAATAVGRILHFELV